MAMPVSVRNGGRKVRKDKNATSQTPERGRLRRSAPARRRLDFRARHRALSLGLGLVGCEGAAPAAVTVVDSAGVQIVLSSGQPSVYAVVDTTPLLSLGGVDEAGPTQFSLVQGIHIDRRGRMWIADGQSNELRIFSMDGVHVKTRGGEGEGPGEFMRIRLIGAFSGDSVLVVDDANGRVAVFDPDGDFIRTERITAGAEAVPRAFDVFADRSILGQLPRVLASVEDGQIIRDTVRLVRIDLERGTHHPQAVALGPLWLWRGRRQIPVPFAVNAPFGVRNGSVHVSDGPAFRVRVFKDGRLTEVFGVARGERRVTDADEDAYRGSIAEYVSETAMVDNLAALAHPQRPTVLPGYSSLLESDDGETWAQIYDPDSFAPAQWDVFDVDRRWLGQVETPARFFPLHIARTALVGLWLDDFGVEYVRAYNLKRG